MGTNIQNKFDFKPYNDKNVVSKPVSSPQVQSAPQEVDEEKSNAAKWMIGLTATAAIVIGGLYAAKHGHLGESAEKFAKKIFGEASKEVANAGAAAAETKAPATSSPAPAGGPSATGGGPIPIVPVATLAFTRKSISKLIKNPSRKLPEILKELQDAGVKLEQKGDNLLEIRTGKKSKDITKLLFNPEGTLASIQRATKKATREIFTFDSHGLAKIEREIQTPSGKPLEYVIEFAENGTIKARKPILNDGLRELPVNSSAAKMFKNEEIVEAFVPRDSEQFEKAVQELNIVRKSIQRADNKTGITFDDILNPFREAHFEPMNAETPIHRSGLQIMIEKKNGKFEGEVYKLILEDMGNVDKISSKTFHAIAENYIAKLKAHKITKPEHVAIVGKPLKECTYNEMTEIIKEVAPEHIGKHGVIADPFKDREQEQKAVIHFLSRATGRSNIDGRTTLLEILKDL